MDTRDNRSTRGRDEAHKSSFKKRAGDRVPMGGYTQQLAVTGIPEGYVGRWFNHEADRIQQALNAGYAPVYNDGSLGDIEVNGGDLAHEDEWRSKPVGQNLTAFLMVIRREWYEESQKIKGADIDLFDQAIAEGNTFNPQGNMVTDPTTYVKEANIETKPRLKR